MRINYVEGVRGPPAELTHDWKYEVPGAVQPMATTLTVRVEPAEEAGEAAAGGGGEGDSSRAGAANTVDLEPAVAVRDPHNMDCPPKRWT